MGWNVNGSKPCPACGKTISLNKELCFTDVMKYGSLEAYNKSIAAEIAKRVDHIVEEKRKRTRKPKTTDMAPTISAMPAEPKPARKPRAKKVPVAVAAIGALATA